MRVYFPPPPAEPSSPDAETPPLAAPAEAVHETHAVASSASVAMRIRPILSLGTTVPDEGFIHALSLLTGLADGLAPKSWRYTARWPRFAPNDWVPRYPRI